MSSSTSMNGFAAHANGVAPHLDDSVQVPESPGANLYGHTPSTSFSSVNGYPPVSYHNEEIVSHLYHSGFQTGNYADTVLHVHQNKYRLHAIILSRSPFLAHLMSTSPQTGGQRTIYVPLEQEPEVTEEGFAIALGYLYSSVSLSLIRPQNSRAVLAAGCLLGGMDDLCAYAYEACRRSMSVDTIAEWLEFVATIPPSDGPSTSDLPPVPVFGHYAERLREEVFNFLVVTLPSLLDVHQSSMHGEPSSSPESGSGRDVLLEVYSKVPFDLFKAAIESPKFQIGSDQARFKFAKDAIEMRKRGIARGTGEETVVLAFGGANAGAVHITRKMRKRPLWKVNS